MKILRHLSSFIAAILFSTTTVADKKKTPSPFTNDIEAAKHFIKPIFSTLDCEGVGVIEAGEVDEHFFNLFFYHDRDRSKTIRQSEFVFSKDSLERQRLAYVFTQMDVDKNSLVSTNEYRDHVISSIDKADINRNGELTEAEAGLFFNIPKKKKKKPSFVEYNKHRKPKDNK